MTTQMPELERDLRQLRLAAILQRYREEAQSAGQNRWPYERYLASLVEQEVDRRTRNRRQRRIQEAHLPLLKELADFDFSQVPNLNQQTVMNLAQGHYIQEREHIVLVGNPGLGKTHVAIGLALSACRQDVRVRFYTVTNLVNELQQAQSDHQLPKFLDKALRHQLVVLDEFGYVPFSPTGAQLLFQFCSTLQEQVSLILTTNLPFADWVQVLGDERLTGGLLDRLTFRSHILEFVGESFRYRQGMTRKSHIGSQADPPSVG